MLIRFNIENFLSINDKQTFSMIAGQSGRDKKFHLIKKSNRNDVNLLKTAVVFGANASGKSNLIKAIDFGKKTVLRGTPANKTINFQNFLLSESSSNSSSRLEYEIKHKGASYAYGFTFNKHCIIEEWLYEINKIKEEVIFERRNTTDFNLEGLNKRNKPEEEQQFIDFIAKGTPDNQLFLTEIHNRKVKENVSNIDSLLTVIDWFKNVLTIIYPHSRGRGIEFQLKENAKLTEKFEQFLMYFDTGIDGISLEKADWNKLTIPEKIKSKIKEHLLTSGLKNPNVWIDDSESKIGYILSKEGSDVVARKLMTKHNIFLNSNNTKRSKDSILFDIWNESDGTQRIMDFIPMLIDLCKGEKVYVIDEMERSLHPNLMYDLIDSFLDLSKTVNSQLVIASHESTILTQKLLRKDEIWFITKEKGGNSSISSLEDYAIRFDKKIRKDYLHGRYRAIPRLGNRNKLSI